MQKQERRSTTPLGYEAYYGFVEPPFSLAPGLRFAFPSRSFASVLGEVRHALDRREGLIVVSGEVGTGKTMLCRALANERDARTFVSLVLDPCVSAEEILLQALSDFGVVDRTDPAAYARAAAVPRHQLVLMLQRFLASLVPLGARAVLIIDEAQHLHPAVLEQVRLWSNFETDRTKLLQIVLAGQSELDELLGRPELRQLRQRISRRCELTRLLRDEVAAYIEHRLRVARGPGDEQPAGRAALTTLAHGEYWRVRFTPAAAWLVSRISRGIPRVVNLLADRALEVGCERQARAIDAWMVRTAARRLNLLAPALPPPVVWAGAAAASLAIAALPLIWREEAGAAPTAAAPPAVHANAGAGAAGRAVPRPLPVQDGVTITVAAFRTEQRARAVAAELAASGFPAFARGGAGRSWHQVIVGPYVSAEEALAAQRALAEQGVAGTEIRLESAVAEAQASVAP